MRLLVCTLVVSWFALGAPGNPAAYAAGLHPDPPPGARRVVVDWTYTYLTYTRRGHMLVRCTVFPRRPRRCVLVTR